jgi:hypothetical protein
MAYMIVPRKVELYGSTSYVFSNMGVPRNSSPEATTIREHTELAFEHQVINVDQSPVSSTFGFYQGKVSGPILAIGFTACIRSMRPRYTLTLHLLFSLLASGSILLTHRTSRASRIHGGSQDGGTTAQRRMCSATGLEKKRG